MPPQSAKSRTRRRLLLLLLLGGCFWVLLWAIASASLPSVARQALPVVQARLVPIGIGLGDVAWSRLRISPSLNGLALSDLETRLDLNLQDRIQLRTELSIATLEVRLSHPFSLRGSLQATGLELRLDPSDLPGEMPFDRFANARFSIGRLPLGDPQQLANEIRTKLKALFVENQAVGEVEFSGEVVVVIDAIEHVARLHTARVGESFKLRFSEADLREIALAKGLDLVDEQIDIVSRYPLRVPQLLTLTEQARALSTRHAPDDVWLRDAMRHVIWSFMLSRSFGSEFATKVTDAHELQPGNSPNERLMDFHNNAIGRRLLAENVPLADLPERVRSDPAVIRHPDEVAHFGEDRLLR
jgi:hypothetical protein